MMPKEIRAAQERHLHTVIDHEADWRRQVEKDLSAAALLIGLALISVALLGVAVIAILVRLFA